MFYCAITKKLSKPNEKCQKVVVLTRDRIYTAKIRNEETGEWEKIEIGRGTEIVKECNATTEGVNLWNSWTAEEKAAWVKAD